MALSFNGTTLATNIDAVVFNGTAVSKVMFNEVEVWKKEVALAWSGSSFPSTGIRIGIQCEGNLFRVWSLSHSLGGAYISVNSANGYFTGSSSYSETAIQSSNNLLRWKSYNEYGWGNWVTYDISTKSFSGESNGTGYDNWEGSYYGGGLSTSAGAIRVFNINLNGTYDNGNLVTLK